MGSVAAVDRWREVEHELREMSYRGLDADPQSLLEHDSGGGGVDADIILARFIGLDDEMVEDGVRLQRAEPVILRPIMRRPSVFKFEDAASLPDITLPRATFKLQSGFVLHHLAAEYAPPGIEVGPPTFTFTVLYLRYRRRL